MLICSRSSSCRLYYSAQPKTIPWPTPVGCRYNCEDFARVVIHAAYDLVMTKEELLVDCIAGGIASLNMNITNSIPFKSYTSYVFQFFQTQ
mmetsp:Transcript_7600/g.17409  ORF Transcript_7600/g.17409 Transcript_7600/m.17409 type:complete len:91 (-) Transcript_7600:1452-1724(-)